MRIVYDLGDLENSVYVKYPKPIIGRGVELLCREFHYIGDAKGTKLRSLRRLTAIGAVLTIAIDGIAADGKLDLLKKLYKGVIKHNPELTEYEIKLIFGEPYDKIADKRFKSVEEKEEKEEK